jgi:hypothetical protein
MSRLNPEILKLGKTYWAEFEDCCARGAFKGKFTGFLASKDAEDWKWFSSFVDIPSEYEYIQAHFDAGYIDDLMQSPTSFREYGDGSTP